MCQSQTKSTLGDYNLSHYSEYSEKYITTATGRILFRQRYDTFFSWPNFRRVFFE